MTSCMVIGEGIKIQPFPTTSNLLIFHISSIHKFMVSMSWISGYQYMLTYAFSHVGCFMVYDLEFSGPFHQKTDQ